MNIGDRVRIVDYPADDEDRELIIGKGGLILAFDGRFIKVRVDGLPDNNLQDYYEEMLFFEDELELETNEYC